MLKGRISASGGSGQKAEFLSNMSHELCAPLNAIFGFSQLMEASTPPPTDSQNKSLGQILTAGWHLMELVDEVLNLSLIDSGKLAPALDTASLDEVILECKVMIEPNAKKASIDLMFPHFNIPYLVRVDRSWLNQCRINLLSNAIQYNKPNGMVVVECTQSSSDSVRDSRCTLFWRTTASLGSSLSKAMTRFHFRSTFW